MYGPEFERYWLGIWVLPDARGRGLGSALYAAASDVAREAGKTGFQTELSEVHEDGHRFLAHRGFVETERNKMVRLDLAGMQPPDVRAPAGILLTTLAQRPTAGPGRVGDGAGGLPGHPRRPTSRCDVGTLEAFVARDVERVGIPQGRLLRGRRRGHRASRRVREPDLRRRQHHRRLPRHDRGPARVPRARHRDGAQAGDHRLGGRARPGGARHRQRRGQRADARREPRPGLPARCRTGSGCRGRWPRRADPAAYRPSAPEGITTGNP